MFASRCLESSSTNWVKCTYRDLMRVLGLLQKISCCAKGGHKQYLFQQYNFLFNFYKCVANTNSKEHALSIDQERGKPWIQICHYDPFDTIANYTEMNPRVTLCSYSPINHSFGYLNNTVYLAVMLRVSWNTAEGN